MSSLLSTKYWSLRVPKDFQLSKAVCSYGWALLAPNSWDRSVQHKDTKYRGALKRPLHTSHGLVHVIISQSASGQLDIEVDTSQPMPTSIDQEELGRQVRRMLRLEATDQAAVDAFHLLHAQARAENFGRLFRAPSVWEDLVKCILLCNCGQEEVYLLDWLFADRWGRTVAMNAALCKKYGNGAFPSSSQLASAPCDQLQASCGIGYRAKSIVALAKQVEDGAIDLHLLEDIEMSDEKLYANLKNMPGIGPFSASNMLQLLGRYERIACDSETIRHLKAHHKATQCNASNCETTASKVYEKFAPYQFLAYWFELWKSYEALLGPFADLDESQYKSFTGNNMRKRSVLSTNTKQVSKRKSATDVIESSSVDANVSHAENTRRRSTRLLKPAK